MYSAIFHIHFCEVVRSFNVETVTLYIAVIVSSEQAASDLRERLLLGIQDVEFVQRGRSWKALSSSGQSKPKL